FLQLHSATDGRRRLPEDESPAGGEGFVWNVRELHALAGDFRDEESPGVRSRRGCPHICFYFLERHFYSVMKLSNLGKGIIALALVLIVGILVFAVRKQRASAGEFFTTITDVGPLRNVVNATGVVQTVVTVQVGSQVSGQVEELYADFNSVVKHGQLLAKLDPRNFQAQVENSRATVAASQARVQSADAETRTQAANLDSAKANLEAAKVARDNTAILFQRASELAQSGVASRNDYDNAKANADSARAKYEQAQAAVAQAEAQNRSAAAGLQQAKAQLLQAEADLNRARLNLEYCNIYSPVDGVVISRNVDVGQTIAARLQSPTLFT